MKKFMCFMLAALMLVLGVACDGSSGNGNDDPVKNSGELTADGVERVSLYQWKDNAWYDTDSEDLDEDNWTYDDLKSALADGGRWSMIVVTPKAMRSFNGKKASKVSFTVEADRDVTVYFRVGFYTGDNTVPVTKKVDLKAGVKQDLVFDLNADYVSEKGFQIRFNQVDNTGYLGGYVANSPAFTVWTSAVYKVTNLKCYID